MIHGKGKIVKIRKKGEMRNVEGKIEGRGKVKVEGKET